MRGDKYVGYEDFLNAILAGMVKGTTFVLVRKKLEEENEKTTVSPGKRKGGFIKRIKY